jgi:hypothetical protein
MGSARSGSTLSNHWRADPGFRWDDDVHYGVGADTQPSPTVIPAKAGIQLFGILKLIAAFAGMTTCITIFAETPSLTHRHSGESRNPAPGFLEKLDPGFRRDDDVDYGICLVVPELAAKSGRIPASAGMTKWIIGYASSSLS